MLRQGVGLTMLHIDNHSSTHSRETDKIQLLGSRLEEVHDVKLEIFFLPHLENQKAFSTCETHLRCVLCKRMMLRLARETAHMVGAKAVVMGDSLGQVASQTSRNIEVIESAVNIPVLRPLIGFDKVEIVDIAKEIGTYEISIGDAGPCPFVPKKPSTGAPLERVLKEEEKMNIPLLVEGSMCGMKR